MPEPAECSQGFWKNHPEAWLGPSEPTTTVEEAFGAGVLLGGQFDALTLMAVLELKGGGVFKDARQAVVELLNTENPDEDC